MYCDDGGGGMDDVFRRNERKFVWTGCIWLRKGTSGGLL